MKTIILFLKGFLVGIGKIIPGVSGALISITLGIYDECLNAITNFFNEPKKNTTLLFPIGIGVLSAIIVFSKIINITLNYYYFITMLFFIGLIIGAIPSLLKETNIKKYFYLSILSFTIITLISIINIDNTNQNPTFFSLFLAGVLEAISTIVPGISGTVLLMLFGFYNIIIETLSNLTNLKEIVTNLKILIPFTIGLIVTIIGLTIIINKLFKNYKQETYAIILGIVISTTITLINKILIQVTLTELILGITLFTIGIVITRKLS